MKRISFMMAALLVAMVGCQKEPQTNDAKNNGAEVYMTFSVKAVTKSQTDNTGNSNSNATPETEVGKDVENKISDIQLYLHSNNGEIKAESVNLVGGGVNYTATFKDENIKAGVEYKIYVICNDAPTVTNELNSMDAVKKHEAGDGRELNISADNKFLMTNAKTAQPITITTEQLTAAMSPATPLNLGIVEVERAVARFDYASVKEKNLYQINSDNVYIALERAAVINVSAGSYYFRRVAADNTGSNPILGGVEGIQANNLSNYVVDYDWDTKKSLYSSWAENNSFLYPLEDKTTWKWIDLTNLDDADNIDGTINGASRNYNFLAYVSENTIPGVAEQINGLSTGVVFRGYLHNGTDRLEGTEYLYVYANKYYGNWEAVQTAATTANADAALTAAYEAVKATPTDLKACANAGFTVYTPNGSKNYPVDYYYWNRHNDNNNPSEMGVMEFAVVRNNVYKLAVTNINQYGHPDNSDGDPDPVKPQNPDEQKRHYFQVSVKVLPWTVRVNDIEF